MRRTVAILIVALFGALPVIDTVACPDGCTDATHSTASWERVENGAVVASCGLCLNAFFIHRTVMGVTRSERLVLTIVAGVIDSSTAAPHIVERPPRVV